MSGWDIRPVPDLIFSIAFRGGAEWNETRYADERFDRLLLEARSTVDFDKRKAMYCDMQRISVHLARYLHRRESRRYDCRHAE